MTTEGAVEAARAHAVERARLAARVGAQMRAEFATIDRARISESWAARLGRVFALVTGGQRMAADAADGYLAASLAEQGLDSAAVGAVETRALSGVASDGRGLLSLLSRPAVLAKYTLARGGSVPRAVAAGGALAEMIGRTQIADAGRAADQVALTARPAVSGYTRMIVGGTCARCLILAGRWYRHSDGFLRHPSCDCVHIPARENASGDFATDPRSAFDAMPRAEQERVFGKGGAEAIRAGADPAQVVNARRGMYTAGGRLFTRESAGRARARIMPEQIFRDARNRDDAIRLLRLHGYIR